MIHLDTSFIIAALVPGSAAEVKVMGRLASGEDLGVSTIQFKLGSRFFVRHLDALRQS
jgi:hypothetical protein